MTMMVICMAKKEVNDLMEDIFLCCYELQLINNMLLSHLIIVIGSMKIKIILERIRLPL